MWCPCARRGSARYGAPRHCRQCRMRQPRHEAKHGRHTVEDCLGRVRKVENFGVAADVARSRLSESLTLCLRIGLGFKSEGRNRWPKSSHFSGIPKTSPKDRQRFAPTRGFDRDAANFPAYIQILRRLFVGIPYNWVSTVELAARILLISLRLSDWHDVCSVNVRSLSGRRGCRQTA